MLFKDKYGRLLLKEDVNEMSLDEIEKLDVNEADLSEMLNN